VSPSPSPTGDYETAAFTANPWTWRYFGFDAGFDRFEDFMGAAATRGFHEGGDHDGTLRRLATNALDWWQGQDMFMSWETFADEVIAWTHTAEEPYLCWIFLVDAHLPYLPPKGYPTRSWLTTYPANLGLFLDRDLPLSSLFDDVLTEAYQNMLTYIDAFVGRLADELDEGPITVVHGDHGEAFGEQGMYGHGTQLYDELVTVPLVVSNGPTGRVEEPFSLRRLPDLLRGLADGDERVHERLTEPCVFASTRMPNVAVRGRDWRYIWSPAERELYNLEAGEDEQLDDEALRAVGGDLVEWWQRSQTEKEWIVDAAQELAASGQV